MVRCIICNNPVCHIKAVFDMKRAGWVCAGCLKDLADQNKKVSD